MALYTQLDAEQLAAVVAAFGLGALLEGRGIPQGSINTNYRLETTSGRFFLRHSTVRSAQDLTFEWRLLTHLAQGHFPAPTPVPTRDGAPFLELAGGRVSLFHFLPGEEMSRERLREEHCQALGREVGKLHRVGNAFLGDRPNPYGPATVRGWLEALTKNPDAEVSAVAAELLAPLDGAERALGTLLPRGPIHADIFMDNVKWLGDAVAAIFDFEMACRDYYVLDLAITLNAWCFHEQYLPAQCRALVRGYQLERPLSAVERDGLYACALFGAIRYTASRIRDFHLSPLPPEQLFRKSFRTYLARARALGVMGPAGFKALVGL